LRAADWSDPAITRAGRSGRLVVIRHGVYGRFPAHPVADRVPDPVADRVAAARAAAIACSGSVISHRSGALMHRFALLNPPPARPDLTVQPNGTGDVQGALLHRATLLPDDVVTIDGAHVTSATRTAIDVARTVSVGAGVVALDSALNKKLTTLPRLEEMIVRCRRWPGIRKARAALALADPNAESALESVSRLVIARLGLPAPKTQVIVLDQFGRFVGRCDFYWDEFGVFGEADGWLKYATGEEEVGKVNTLVREKLRQEDLENLALIGVRWGWEDVRYRQPMLRRRIENAFERGRRRDASGFPRNWSVVYR
jgi:hypothetical protein